MWVKLENDIVDEIQAEQINDAGCSSPLDVSKDGQSKEKGKTKQVTLISDFHVHGSKSSLWPIRLARC